MPIVWTQVFASDNAFGRSLDLNAALGRNWTFRVRPLANENGWNPQLVSKGTLCPAGLKMIK